MSDPRDVQDNKGMAIIAYILFFVPLIAGTHKTSPYVKYHTNQGTALFITALAYGLADGIITAVVGWIPLVGWLITLVLSLAGLVFLVLLIMGIINAANGEEKPLPIIGGLQIIK